MATQTPRDDSQAAPSPAKKRRPGFLLKAATTLYLGALFVIAAGNLIGPEIWWFGSLNLYLPQWIWALPCALLLPWYLLTARRWSWIPLAALLWVMGPLMGFCWRWFTPATPENGIHLRVLTYNVKFAYRDAQAVAAEFERDKPDLILMQDAAGAAQRDPIPTALAGWNVKTIDQYILASRYPISDPEVRWITPQQNHRVARCVMQVGNVPIIVYTAHLASPRGGLGAVRHIRSQGIGGLESNVDNRLQEADMLADHIKDEHGPLILTGDLNAPVQSLVCRKLFGVGLRDAFSAAGRGYGYTYGQTTKLKQPYVRIDHIMTSADWQILDCWAGNQEGSDHIPVIADLYLPAGR